MTFTKVVIGKVDLDTVGVAFFARVTREHEVVSVRGQATDEDLQNNNVLCIEVGGSGQINLNDWDHHQEGGPVESATWQAAMIFPFPYHYDAEDEEEMQRVARLSKGLIEYIDQLDCQGPKSFPMYGQPGTYLSDIFSGMLLVTRDQIEKLHKGIEILTLVVEKGIDPSGQMPNIPEWQAYVVAKEENNHQLAKAVEDAQWTKTTSGLKLGFLETKFFGAPGALYGHGADVIVAMNPNFRGVKKFTVAGNNGVKVDACKDRLNELEANQDSTQTWGGPPTGTILGSPFGGSNLTIHQVVEVVEELL